MHLINIFVWVTMQQWSEKVQYTKSVLFFKLIFILWNKDNRKSWTKWEPISESEERFFCQQEDSRKRELCRSCYRDWPCGRRTSHYQIRAKISWPQVSNRSMPLISIRKSIFRQLKKRLLIDIKEWDKYRCCDRLYTKWFTQLRFKSLLRATDF